MTRRITITLPEELAARLDREPDASAFISQLIDARLRSENTWEMLREYGYVPTPESRARAQKRLADARASVTAESIAESHRRIRGILGEEA